MQRVSQALAEGKRIIEFTNKCYNVRKGENYISENQKETI